MSLKVRQLATEKSTYILQIEFELLSKNNIKIGLIPNSDIRWTLFDKDRNVINNKEDISLSNNNLVYIILSGDDLLLNGYPAKRLVVIEGTYNSSFLVNIPFYEEIEFTIENVKDQVEVV